MAIQYYMRGYNTAAPGTVGYVDWVVDNTPDTAATYVPSPYVSGNINHIIVNRVVTSKVDNFLNPIVQPSFVSTNYANPADKYLLHLNSYDWLNPNPPNLTESLPPANQPIGIAVVRGTSNGTTLNPYSSLFWDETTSQWSFAQINASGAIGSPQGLAFGNGFVDGYLLVDGYLAVSNVSLPITDWAQSGLIRLPNAQSISARSASASDIVLVASDSNNNVILGDATHNVIIGGTAANGIGSPSNFLTTIAGNLLVLGSTTTVESTTVDIVGRVIHANWSTSNNPAVPPPSLIAGYSVHRGAQLNAPTQNDGAAWIWTEGSLLSGADGYWRAATIPADGYGTDGYTIANSPNILSVMAKDFTVASTPNPTLGTLPGVGGLRTQNNTTAVSARKSTLVSDLLLLGTSTDTIIHGDASNTGQTFNIGTGSYIFEIGSSATYTIIPLSAGITTLQAASTVTGVVYNQATAATGTGAPTTLQAQSITTGTGGLLNLASGSGTVANGVINFQPGGTTALALSAAGSTLHWVNTITSPLLSQDNNTSASATAQTLTVQAQNATGTTSLGGALVLTSGTGTSAAGNVGIQTGGVTRIAVNPTFTTFNDTAAALTVTPVSAGTTQFTYASTVLGAQINQASTASATGAPMLIQAQNAVTTGGSLTLTSGTGVIAGSLHLQTGGVDQILITPTLTTITNNTIIDGTLTVYDGTGIPQIQFSQNNIVFASTDGYATISQAPTYVSSVNGATMTVAAQSALGALGIGGNLVLTSGVGTVLDGYIDLQAGGITVATVEPNKFVFNQGTRRNVTSVSVDGYMDGYYYYQIQQTDSLVAISALSAPLTVILPINPILGDTYEIKDTTGLAGTYPITVDGNGIYIDDPTTPAIALSKAYGDLVVTYTGNSWSVTSYYFEGIL